MSSYQPPAVRQIKEISLSYGTLNEFKKSVQLVILLKKELCAQPRQTFLKKRHFSFLISFGLSRCDFSVTVSCDVTAQLKLNSCPTWITFTTTTKIHFSIFPFVSVCGRRRVKLCAHFEEWLLQVVSDVQKERFAVPDSRYTNFKNIQF